MTDHNFQWKGYNQEGAPPYPKMGQQKYAYPFYCPVHGDMTRQGSMGPQGQGGAGGASSEPQTTAPPFVVQQGIGQQQSFMENILRQNVGMKATVYVSFENDAPWGSKVFEGVIEAAGVDHLIVRDQNTTEHYLIPMIYLDYVQFPEQINYYYPFAPQLTSVAQNP